MMFDVISSPRGKLDIPAVPVSGLEQVGSPGEEEESRDVVESMASMSTMAALPVTFPRGFLRSSRPSI